MWTNKWSNAVVATIKLCLEELAASFQYERAHTTPKSHFLSQDVQVDVINEYHSTPWDAKSYRKLLRDRESTAYCNNWRQEAVDFHRLD